MKFPTRAQIAEIIYPSIFQLSVSLQSELDNVKKLLSQSQMDSFNALEAQKATNIALSNQVSTLQYNLKIAESKVLKMSIIDTYLDGVYDVIDNIAYKGKRFFKGEEVRVFLNQLITPRAYEVLFFKSRLQRNTDDKDWVIKLGDKLADMITWTSDKETSGYVDYLTYPEEVLVYKKEDCEGHAFTMASFEPTVLGVCYGYLTVGSNRFGHAWNVLAYNDKLYHIETTGSQCEIYPWDIEKYEPYFIITKHNTYRVKSGVSFGTLAEKIKEN